MISVPDADAPVVAVIAPPVIMNNVAAATPTPLRDRAVEVTSTDRWFIRHFGRRAFRMCLSPVRPEAVSGSSFDAINVRPAT